MTDGRRGRSLFQITPEPAQAFKGRGGAAAVSRTEQHHDIMCGGNGTWWQRLSCSRAAANDLRQPPDTSLINPTLAPAALKRSAGVCAPGFSFYIALVHNVTSETAKSTIQ